MKLTDVITVQIHSIMAGLDFQDHIVAVCGINSSLTENLRKLRTGFI